MKILTFLFFMILTSCHFRVVSPGYYTQPTTIVTTPPVIYPTYNWWSRPYWWNPRPTYLGNVYNNYYYNPPRPTYTPPRSSPPRTNLPLNTGPRGGRRR